MRKTRRDFIVGGMSAGIVGDASGRPIETIFGDQIEQTHRTPFDASIRVESLSTGTVPAIRSPISPTRPLNV